MQNSNQVANNGGMSYQPQTTNAMIKYNSSPQTFGNNGYENANYGNQQVNFQQQNAASNFQQQPPQPQNFYTQEPATYPMQKMNSNPVVPGSTSSPTAIHKKNESGYESQRIAESNDLGEKTSKKRRSQMDESASNVQENQIPSKVITEKPVRPDSGNKTGAKMNESSSVAYSKESPTSKRRESNFVQSVAREPLEPTYIRDSPTAIHKGFNNSTAAPQGFNNRDSPTAAHQGFNNREEINRTFSPTVNSNPQFGHISAMQNTIQSPTLVQEPSFISSVLPNANTEFFARSTTPQPAVLEAFITTTNNRTNIPTFDINPKPNKNNSSNADPEQADTVGSGRKSSGKHHRRKRSATAGSQVSPLAYANDLLLDRSSERLTAYTTNNLYKFGSTTTVNSRHAEKDRLTMIHNLGILEVTDCIFIKLFKKNRFQIKQDYSFDKSIIKWFRLCD
jgi:hypothetical protein